MAEAAQHTFQVLTKRARAPRSSSRRDLPWPGERVDGRQRSRTRAAIDRADYLREVPAAVRFISAEPLLGPLDGLDLDGIDWLIAGGESGPGHRPIDAEWVRELRDRCAEAGVAVLLQAVGRTYLEGWRATCSTVGSGRSLPIVPIQAAV